MDWTQTGVILGAISVFSGVTIWFFTKVDSDIKGIGERVDKLANRLDGHASRIDQLYKMFVDLLKEGRRGEK